MATLRKRGSQWEAQVRRQGWPTQSKSFPTKPEARRWGNVIESDMTRGVFVDLTILEHLTLGDLLRRYMQEISPTKKSCETEQYRIRAFLRDHLASTKLSDLNNRRIAVWRDQRLTEVTGSTVNRDLNLLSHVFNMALKEWDMHAYTAQSELLSVELLAFPSYSCRVRATSEGFAALNEMQGLLCHAQGPSAWFGTCSRTRGDLHKDRSSYPQ